MGFTCGCRDSGGRALYVACAALFCFLVAACVFVVEQMSQKLGVDWSTDSLATGREGANQWTGAQQQPIHAAATTDQPTKPEGGSTLPTSIRNDTLQMDCRRVCTARTEIARRPN
jgi:hypothetical protein